MGWHFGEIITTITIVIAASNCTWPSQWIFNSRTGQCDTRTLLYYHPDRRHNVSSLRNKEKYENVGFEIRGWGPRSARGSHASRQGEPCFWSVHVSRIPFSLIFCFHYTLFATFPFFLSSPSFQITHTLFSIVDYFVTVPFPVTKFTRKTYSRNSFKNSLLLNI